MKRTVFCVTLFATCLCHADISHYFKKVTREKTEKSALNGIYFIYLINLDQRPEKLEKCLSQLKTHGISPYRFSAVCGWDLSIEAFTELGVKFLPGMLSDEWVVHFPPEKQGTPDSDFLREESYGKTFFSRWITPGAIGCTLSHLSVLQDAYDAGYETIWVMEDDISVVQDPHLLPPLINQLDALVSKKEWDILFTDIDTADGIMYAAENDFESDLKGNLGFFWRPDIDLSDRSPFAKRTILNKDFMKIGSRMRTHSMIIRRSGIKKILDFEKQHHIFIPYDHELAIVPSIQMFSLRYNLVTHAVAPSDTRSAEVSEKAAWENQDRKSVV